MMYELAIRQPCKMMRNLTAILDKAEAHAAAKKFDVEVLLQSRLIADQFNFIRQVQIMCDTAKLGVARLTGKDAPTHDDSEKTVADLKKRISSTMTFLESFKEQDFAESATRKVSQPRWEGKYLTGKEFFEEHFLPNFYFHTTTAYAILRANGVDVGKKDYLGPMPYKN